MTLDAVLVGLELSSPDPAALARFYEATYRMQTADDGELTVCRGAQRELRFRRGPANQLLAARFALPSAERLAAAEQRWRDAGLAPQRDAAAGTVQLIDPAGHALIFGVKNPTSDTLAADPMAARLQHIALRTPTPEPMLEFYADKLGFVVSDLVRDPEGVLRAAFVRADEEHHTLALFRAPQAQFDHFSCETSDWSALRVWADHMASVDVPLHWGVGRHGPGNDTFFMVRDPDGNLAEISSDLERCAPDRPVGLWPHAAKTLNQWGVAILRS